MGSIAINKPDTFLNFKDGQNGGVGYEDPTDLDTEVHILRSDLLALQVMRELNMEPRFPLLHHRSSLRRSSGGAGLQHK